MQVRTPHSPNAKELANRIDMVHSVSSQGYLEDGKRLVETLNSQNTKMIIDVVQTNQLILQR